MSKFKHSRRNSENFISENMLRDEYTHPSLFESHARQSNKILFSSKFSPTKKGSPEKVLVQQISELDLSLGEAFQGQHDEYNNLIRWKEISLSRITQEIRDVERRETALKAAIRQRAISFEGEESSRKRLLEYESKIKQLELQARREELACQMDIKKINHDKIAKLQESQLDVRKSMLLHLASEIMNSSSKSLPELPIINENEAIPGEKIGTSLIGPVGEVGNTSSDV
jgi:hypothetical protein